MLSAVKLPLPVDASRLHADLAQIDPSEYIPHFNKSYYEGEWSAVALRSTSGSASQIYPDPTKQEFLDTPVLDRCSYFRELLQTFECPLLSARLLRLQAGSRVLEHRD